RYQGTALVSPPAPPARRLGGRDARSHTRPSIGRAAFNFSDLVPSYARGSRGMTGANVPAGQGWGGGGGRATRSLRAATGVARPDGAQPPRSSARVPRGRTTPTAAPPLPSRNDGGRLTVERRGCEARTSGCRT